VLTRVPTRDVNALTGWALARGIDLPSLTLSAPSLEETYLRLVAEAGHGDD
jgi:ABC-2 type transport system ATP-binding protein